MMLEGSAPSLTRASAVASKRWMHSWAVLADFFIRLLISLNVDNLPVDTRGNIAGTVAARGFSESVEDAAVLQPIPYAAAEAVLVEKHFDDVYWPKSIEPLRRASAGPAHGPHNHEVRAHGVADHTTYFETPLDDG